MLVSVYVCVHVSVRVCMCVSAHDSVCIHVSECEHVSVYVRHLRISKLKELSDFSEVCSDTTGHMCGSQNQNREGLSLCSWKKSPWLPVPLPYLKVSRTQALR